MTMTPKRTLLITATLALGYASIGFTPLASASRDVPTAVTQKQLENEINSYASLLGQLGADIQGSRTLEPAHARDLNALSTTADLDVNNLVAKVEIDTTPAELSADATAIDNLRSLFAVLAPQVSETLEADDEQQEYNTVNGDLAALQSSLDALQGTPGYQAALSGYQDQASSVRAAQRILTHIATRVLTQSASGFPRNTAVFTEAAANLETVQTDLTRAYHDETVIGLSFGGYSGN
jgi:hypothetical protein